MAQTPALQLWRFLQHVDSLKEAVSGSSMVSIVRLDVEPLTVCSGKPAKLNAWPWIAALGYDNPNTGGQVQ